MRASTWSLARSTDLESRRPTHPPVHTTSPSTAGAAIGTLLRTSHIWLLAPTWIALNAAIGVYAGTGLFNLVQDESEKFPNQILAGGLSPLEITLGLAAVGIVFVAGLIYWGNRFKNDAADDDHLLRHRRRRRSRGGRDRVQPQRRRRSRSCRLPLAVVAAVGLFVLAGATPAALGLLADMSEAYPDDRGAVMGLYGVFLALGQIIGNLVGGWAPQTEPGSMALFIATLLFVGIAVVPLFWLRRYEHEFEAGPTGATA